MKKQIILGIVILIFGCKERRQMNIDGAMIAMPEYHRKATGYDSIQLINIGKWRYNESKKDFEKGEDSVYANFCYPNKYIRYDHDSDYVIKLDSVYIISSAQWKTTDLFNNSSFDSTIDIGYYKPDTSFIHDTIYIGDAASKIK